MWVMYGLNGSRGQEKEANGDQRQGYRGHVLAMGDVRFSEETPSPQCLPRKKERNADRQRIIYTHEVLAFTQ